jgi:hypothetical protein
MAKKDETPGFADDTEGHGVSGRLDIGGADETEDVTGHGASGRFGLGSDLPSLSAGARFDVDDTDDVTGHSAKAFKADDADDDTEGHGVKFG